ncbi:hypothetical protein KQ237_04385 [Staphylococcus haemolyticus]|uniref:hypothetical protein n=1 Tax=Staphylococcus haemolyticus TaxID=1283 RepID=UPI001CA5A960|nr:hypothetical protein [Staphylococcus haemolyticus]
MLTHLLMLTALNECERLALAESERLALSDPLNDVLALVELTHRLVDAECT